MGKEMNMSEQISTLIDRYADLQRIKTAPDRDSEIDYQIKLIKAKLEAAGIVTEKIEK